MVSTHRIAGAGGIAFALLFLITILLSQATTPDEAAGPAAWRSYAADNEDNLRLAALTMGLGAFAFIFFLGQLRDLLGSVWITIGGTVGITSIAIGVALNTGASGNADLPGETIEAVADLSGAGFGVAAVGFAALLVGIGILNPALQALPRWIATLALVTGLCFLLQLGVLLSENEDNAFGVFFPLGFLGLFVFSLAAGVTFLRSNKPVHVTR